MRAYAEAPVTDDLLLIVAGKIDTRSQQTKWYKTVESAGVAMPIWPMAVAQLPAWINQRMKITGMRPTRDAALVLAERVEGNLLACAQEIDKLFLIHGSAEINAEMIIDAVANSARFDIFGLVDAALAGNGERVARMMSGLRGEGVEPILVLWALAREIRALASMSFEVSRGISPDQVMRNQRVWEKRKPLIQKGLRRSPRQWWFFLYRAGQIDRMIKGQATGNVWDELLQLGLMMAGIRLARAS
ncbi:MAG: DNA polymerase III subunit delta [Anaerolineales bacterium]|nr:DNA polymerase III subunit delta [Anaerolineales bacterium]